VWNDTEDHRVVLLLHLKRPLRFPGSLVRDALFAVMRASPFVRDGVRNIERWDEMRTAAAECR
jgi:ornithine lipid ester-linked acyl 2-hydroxylase